jgi:Arc/MetJ-type ribon-helix-helix transcriptional regulator
MATTPVQVRIPREMVKDLDRWVQEGRVANRSEAVKTIVALYNERERVRNFYQILANRSREAKENPDDLLPLEGLS